MAAMKPRTGDGPLEATAEGRGIVVRIPTEGGGRLVIEMSPQEAGKLAEVLTAAICLPVLRPVCDHCGACGVRLPRGLLFGAWDRCSAREPVDRSVGGDAHVWNRGFACGTEGAQMARESAVSA